MVTDKQGGRYSLDVNANSSYEGSLSLADPGGLTCLRNTKTGYVNLFEVATLFLQKGRNSKSGSSETDRLERATRLCVLAAPDAGLERDVQPTLPYSLRPCEQQPSASSVRRQSVCVHLRSSCA